MRCTGLKMQFLKAYEDWLSITVVKWVAVLKYVVLISDKPMAFLALYVHTQALNHRLDIP